MITSSAVAQFTDILDQLEEGMGAGEQHRAVYAIRSWGALSRQLTECGLHAFQQHLFTTFKNEFCYLACDDNKPAQDYYIEYAENLQVTDDVVINYYSAFKAGVIPEVAQALINNLVSNGSLLSIIFEPENESFSRLMELVSDYSPGDLGLKILDHLLSNDVIPKKFYPCALEYILKSKPRLGESTDLTVAIDSWLAAHDKEIATALLRDRTSMDIMESAELGLLKRAGCKFICEAYFNMDKVENPCFYRDAKKDLDVYIDINILNTIAKYNPYKALYYTALFSEEVNQETLDTLAENLTYEAACRFLAGSYYPKMDERVHWGVIIPLIVPLINEDNVAAFAARTKRMKMRPNHPLFTNIPLYGRHRVREDMSLD